MSYDAVALGELLIDFTPKPSIADEEVYFQKNAGGAPANVLAAMARLGKRTAFIGKVGQDAFGTFLAGVLEDNGVSASGLVFSETEHTTLAFVELDAVGDRAFTFYRKPGADQMLKENELAYELFDGAKLFHYGSVSMTHEPARSATLAAAAYAKELGLLVSYDPNLRLGLWSDAETARFHILRGMEHADVVKLSEEELVFLAGTSDPEQGTLWLYEQFGTPLLCITLGSAGCYYRCGARTGHVAAFVVEVVDTTGAGDAFMGGILAGLLEAGVAPAELRDEQLRSLIRAANAAGSLAATKPGGIRAMPERSAIEELLIRK